MLFNYFIPPSCLHLRLVPVAKKAGATIVIVNGEPTAMDRMAAEVVIGDIGQALAGMIDP